MAQMTVELVAVEQRLWSGEATFVFARTTRGEIGIMPKHIPLMAELVDDAIIRIDTTEGESLTFAVDGGFMSVSDSGVTILAEDAEVSTEIDEVEAQAAADSSDPRTVARGRARLRALGRNI